MKKWLWKLNEPFVNLGLKIDGSQPCSCLSQGWPKPWCWQKSAESHWMKRTQIKILQKNTCKQETMEGYLGTLWKAGQKAWCMKWKDEISLHCWGVLGRALLKSFQEQCWQWFAMLIDYWQIWKLHKGRWNFRKEIFLWLYFLFPAVRRESQIFLPQVQHWILICEKNEPATENQRRKYCVRGGMSVYWYTDERGRIKQHQKTLPILTEFWSVHTIPCFIIC